MKYRAIATVSWDFDTQLSHKEALEFADLHLGSFLKQDEFNELRLVVRLDKLKEKVEKVKLGEFKIEDVIPFVNKEDEKKEYCCDGVQYAVKMNSHRYFTFRECLKCVACGLPGTRVFLECHLSDKSPHFNFYGEEDEKLILLTKDHIHAKAFGGEDRHSNYQTMCLVCNNLKGHSNLTLDGVRELRNVYNENKNKVTKKKLYSLIEETRLKIEQPWPNLKSPGRLSKMRPSADVIVAAYDINLYKISGEICGKYVYDPVDVNHKHIGCIKKGTFLEPLVATKEKVMCKLSDCDVVVLNHNLVKAKE